MPDEIRFSSFESSNGLGNLDEIEGKQVLTYLTPVCPESLTWDDCRKNSDLVTYNREYSWSFIFVELMSYLIILVSLLVLFNVCLVSRRKEKKPVKLYDQ